MNKTVLLILCLCAALLLCSCGKNADLFPDGFVSPAETEDDSLKEDPAPAQSTAAPVEEPVEPEPEIEFVPAFSFSTTDRSDNPVDETVFSGHTLTILNFWEPWCGPCVAEMPELQKLYEDYAEKGLQIIGVYSTPGMEGDVDSVLEQAGVSFPILHYTDAFDRFQTGYVPTTILVDGSGNPVGETLIGSRSYADWETLILEYMNNTAA